MSLVGNLEDLSLPDILQIVSLSRKSGILMLEREGQQGKIIIRSGKVIQTVSPRTGRTLGEQLTARGLVRPDDLRNALEIQRSGGGRELLGGILVQQGLIDEATLEKVVQEQIEDAIVYFLSWKEGTFSFELADIKGRGEFSVDPQAFILERGIDTQWLVLEGTRLIDERSRAKATAPAAAPAAEAAGETSFADIETGGEETAAEGRALVVVDDDPVFLGIAVEHLAKLGFRAVACETGAAALAAVEAETARGAMPAVLTDVVMPTLDSQGFLGGLELLEKMRQSHPGLPVVAVTAYPDENVRAQVLELGGAFLLKPGAGDTAGLPGFFARLGSVLGPATVPAAPSAPSAARPQRPPAAQAAAPPVRAAVPSPSPEPPAPKTAVPAPAATPARDEQLLELDPLAATREALAQQELAAAEATLSPGESTLLRDMLQELKSPRAASEIGLLILRFAAELLNRAVLFVVKGGKATGLGGFGVEATGGPDRRGIRGIVIPLDEPSVLAAVVRGRSPFRGPLDEGAWNRALLDQLGGKTPADAVALPLVSGGKVRVILYGDNLPESRPVSGVRALELFLMQAGLTLERALLEKKLHEAGPGAAPAARREQHVGGVSR